ncbi:MAG TPA: hypothetical protein PK103_05465 [Elusimicrobiales bacterium]|nr:hypothetical protein [Elusimicrobiales bacterium]HOL62796.1 hypothetical protein [Elusimicrobiales bacterium]
MNLIKKHISLVLITFASLIILYLTLPILNTETFSRFESYYYIYYSLKMDSSETFKIFLNMPLSQFFYFITNHFNNYFSYIFLWAIIFMTLIILSKISDTISSKYNSVLLFLFTISTFYFYNYAADLEQIAYSLYIILFLLIFIEREKNYLDSKITLDVLSGILLGFTFLIRSALIALPILLIIYDIIDKKKNFSYKKSLFMFVSSYIPLIPWILISKQLLGTFLLTEYKRANLNIITGALGITITAEGDFSKLLGANEINPYIFAIKMISAKPLDYMLAIFRRLVFFFTSNIFLIIPSAYAIYKGYDKKKEIKIITIFILTFVFIHCLFSVEKRYFFPAAIIMAVLSSSIIEINDEKKEISLEFIKKIAAILTVPVLIVLWQISKYSLDSRQDIHTFIQKRPKSHPNLHLIASLNSLSYFEGEKAKEYIKSFLEKAKDYPIKTNVSQTFDILNDKEIKQTQISYPFNNHLIKAIYLIKTKETKKAEDYINENWDRISQSYLRENITSSEYYIDGEIRKYIKETGYIYNSFALVEPNIKKASELCVSFNNIINKLGSKDRLDCNMESRVLSKQIENFCMPTKKPEFEEIMEIIKLEEKKELEKAKTQIYSMINKYPDYYKIYNEAGNIHMLSGDFKTAKDFFQKSIELCPYAKDSYYGLGAVYKKLGLKKENEELMKKAALKGLSLSAE